MGKRGEGERPEVGFYPPSTTDYPAAGRGRMRSSQGRGTLGKASQEQQRSHIWKRIASDFQEFQGLCPSPLGRALARLQLVTQGHSSQTPMFWETPRSPNSAEILGGREGVDDCTPTCLWEEAGGPSRPRGEGQPRLAATPSLQQETPPPRFLSAPTLLPRGEQRQKEPEKDFLFSSSILSQGSKRGVSFSKEGN